MAAMSRHHEINGSMTGMAAGLRIRGTCPVRTVEISRIRLREDLLENWLVLEADTSRM